MKKMIARKMYNVDNASMVAMVNSGRGATRCKETLFRTHSRGDYFLLGRGGAQTRWNGSEDIVAVSVAQANHWCKKNGLGAIVGKEKND